MNFKFKIIIYIVALLGFILSMYLAYEYSQPGELGCPVEVDGVFDCEAVRQSKHSELWGIKLPVYGSLYFFGLTVFVGLGFYKPVSDKVYYYEKLLFIGIIFGFLFESYMTYLQFFVIDAICLWCLLVYADIIALLVLNTVRIFLLMKNKQSSVIK